MNWLLPNAARLFSTLHMNLSAPLLQGELCCGTPVHDARTGETYSFTLQFVNASTAVYRICCIPDEGEPYVLVEYGKDEDFVYMHRCRLHVQCCAAMSACPAQLSGRVTHALPCLLQLCSDGALCGDVSLAGSHQAHEVAGEHLPAAARKF